MKTKIFFIALTALLGIIAITAIAQVNVAFNLNYNVARINGVLNATVLATLLLVPIAIVQNYRKPRLWIYGKIAACGMVVGTFFYQYVGLVGMESQLLTAPVATALVLFGMCLCLASSFYGLLGHRISFMRIS